MKTPKIRSERFLSDSLKQKIWIADQYLNDDFHTATQKLIEAERQKLPPRFDVINFLLQSFNRDTNYLEIGVRNLDANFNKITADAKYCVDPGFEVVENHADFKMISDEFFAQLSQGNILDPQIKFDVIFIDGLHLADQVERDINNSLQFLSNDGFLVLHDCNPPTEFNASENYDYRLSPATDYWNGTTWKAFFSARKREDIYSCCIDSDWGIGIVSKSKNLGTASTVTNPYFEYKVFEENRKESLNLVSFEEFKKLV